MRDSHFQLNPARTPGIRDLGLTVRRVLEALATYAASRISSVNTQNCEDQDTRQALAFAAALMEDKVLPRQGGR